MRLRAVEPASHNRFYLSPYYPVFGSRMVMIGHPDRQDCTRRVLFPGLRRGESPEEAQRRHVALGLALRQAGRAAHQLLRGPDEPGVVRAASAAEPLVDGVHARVAEHRGGFGVGHVQRAGGRAGRE